MKLNCDLGEGKDDIDALVIPHIDMASIACGGHAGNDTSMLRTIALCQRHGTAIGAHPAYPDREHFGRRSLNMKPAALLSSVCAQILQLQKNCLALGAQLSYIKPHGALYNDSLSSPELFDLLLAAINKTVPNLPLVILATPHNDRLKNLAGSAGIELWFEAFADRLYADDGTLVSREHKHAVHSDSHAVAEQARLIVNHHYVMSENRRSVPIQAHCLCVHSDSPAALDAILMIRKSILDTR